MSGGQGQLQCLFLILEAALTVAKGLGEGLFALFIACLDCGDAPQPGLVVAQLLRRLLSAIACLSEGLKVVGDLAWLALSIGTSLHIAEVTTWIVAAAGRRAIHARGVAFASIHFPRHEGQRIAVALHICATLDAAIAQGITEVIQQGLHLHIKL